MIIKNTKNKGFTIVELIISSSIMLSFLAILTSFFFAFNTSANYKIAKMQLTSSIKTAIDRIDKELSDVVRVINTTTIINGVTFTNGCTQTQLALEVAAFDEDDNPMFSSNGAIITDKIGIKIEPNTSLPMLLRNASYLNKILITVEPFSNNGADGIANTIDDIRSARKALKNQVIFGSLMPFKTIGTPGIYDFDPNSEYSGVTSEQLFISNSLFTYLNQSKTVSAIDPRFISSIKVNLFGEVQSKSKSLSARQEAQIVFRNFR
jgi:type II secretory pathway pseudopilin PulG